MPKKGKKKNAQKARRNAREIQTPVSDRANSTHRASDSESQDAESSKHQERRQNLHNQGRPNKFARSPTRKGDFAPGEISDNYESNDETDPELDNESEQEALMEHQSDPVGRWVKDVIRSETNEQSNRMVEEFFTSPEPQYDECEQFFRKLNQQIRAANQKHEVHNIDNGTIPERGYVDLCRTWRQQYADAEGKHSQEDAWDAFHKTRSLLKLFNKRHHLPKSWNISSARAEQAIGSPNPRVDTDSEEDTLSSSDNGQSNQDQVPPSEESGTESQPDDNGDQSTGLDALEARTMKRQRRLTTAKVLYWWPKGTGSQTFVRYGDRSTPIYRIRAGSHESYNPSRVERVLTTKTRGTARVTGTKNGLPEEYWKYERKHVEDFVGVGWKVEDDDENGINPLGLLQPGKGAHYPQTRILVKWKDGTVTLEGRAFIRRITSGSSLDGDRVIYQRAEELESAYREKHGLNDVYYDESDEDFIDDRAKQSTRRNIRFDEMSGDSNAETDDSIQLTHGSRRSEGRRHKMSSLYPTPPRNRERGREDKSKRKDGRIRQLEEELEQLKIGRHQDKTRRQGRTRSS